MKAAPALRRGVLPCHPCWAQRLQVEVELLDPIHTPRRAAAGFTFELCAGLVDKGGKSLAEVAVEEVEEECGYRVGAAALRPLTTAICASGTMGVEHHLFYCEVGPRAEWGPACPCAGDALCAPWQHPRMPLALTSLTFPHCIMRLHTLEYTHTHTHTHILRHT